VAAQAAPPPGCNEDLSGETILFHHFGDLSGALSILSQPVLIGFEDALAYFNSQGGLCGATLEMRYQDTFGRREAAQRAWDQFTQNGEARIMFVYQTEDAELLRQQAAERQVPIVVSSGSVLSLYGESADEPGWVFSVTPLYAGQLGLFCDYLAENWASFGLPGDPVLGHLSWIGAFGQSSDTPEARAYCESRGVRTAGARYYLPGIPDISGLIQALIDEGTNVFYTTSLVNGPAQLVTTLAAMGLRDQVLVAGPNIVLDTTTIELAGETAVGLIGQLPYAWWDEADLPAIQTLNGYWLEQRLPLYSDPAQGLAVRNVAYLLAWAAVDLYAELARETINRAGYANFNGATLYETMTNGQAYTALDGLITIQYGPEVREARLTRMAAVQAVETEGGASYQILPLTDYIPVPDLRPGGVDTVGD
jgi:ABC-type branched-subunit amino acid transport system substrate-binding protein